MANVLIHERTPKGVLSIVSMPGEAMEMRAMLDFKDIPMAQAVALLPS